MTKTNVAKTKTKGKKQILAGRALARANSGLYFLEEAMRHMQGGTDAAYSRSCYILLAYNFELMLSSIFMLASQKITQKDIVNELISASKKHDFANLFGKIPISSRLEISKVEKDESSDFTEYSVELNDGSKIIVQDLIDVRYDFKKDNLRKINPNEVEDIKTAIIAFRKIIETIEKNHIYEI